MCKSGEREETMQEPAKDASLSPAADPVGAGGEGREKEESTWSGLGSREAKKVGTHIHTPHPHSKGRGTERSRPMG